MHLLERMDIGEVARTFSNARIPATMEPQPKPPCCTKTEHYDTDAMGLLLQKASKTGVLNVTGRRGNVQCIRLCDYLGPSLQNTGVATVNYQLKSGTDVGRYSTRAGHQMFPSTIRAHLARQLYYDVDIKNAQPTLLLQLCEKLSIDAPFLRQYVEEREELLKTAASMTVPECTRDEAKNLFIVVLFGGSARTWANTLHGKELNPDAPLREFVESFAKELRRIASLAFHSKQLSGYHSRITKKRKAGAKATDPKMRFLSIVVQTIECDCLRVVDDTLASLGWSMDSLIFDGGLVRRRDDIEFGSRELEACEVAVSVRTGYEIQLTVKPLEPSAELTEHVVRVPETDLDALELLHRLAGRDWATVNDMLYVYNDGVWKQSETAFFQLMMRHSEALGCKYGQMLKNMRDVMQLAKSRNAVDSSWTQRLDRLPPGLVPFADGIYDVATSTLRDFEHDDMITQKFNFNAPSSDEDVSAETEQLRSVLEHLLPDDRLRLEVMTRLAESFFSCTNTHKFFVQLYGEGNNGKTTLMRILQTAFPQWVQMPSVEHLVSHGGSARNSNAPQPWLIDVMGARILCFEEPGEKRPFDGALLKLLRGNGIVTGRALYKGNVSYVPTYTAVIAANDLIEIEPMDEAVLNSFHSFRMPSYFVETGAQPPLGKRYVFQKIPNLEQRFKERKHKIALFFALCDYYKIYTRDGLPPLTSDFSLTRIYHEDHPSFDELFDRCFTLDRDSKLSATEVYNNMQAQGYKESKKKLTIMLEERFKEHVFVRSTKPNNVRTWVGLRALDQGFF